MNIQYRSIGIIHGPFQQLEGMPIQPAGATGVQGTVEVFPEYAEGLQDLEGFSHIFLIYHLHRSEGFKLAVVPFMDQNPHGLFATRAPRRPNPIGLSVVHLLRRDGNVLHIENLDVLDGTPLLDIKPYVGEFDHLSGDSVTSERFGWLEKAKGHVKDKRSDNRFKS